MSDIYLEVTYRRGKVLAAYLYLPRASDDVVTRSREMVPGIVLDFQQDGRPIGMELAFPASLELDEVNRVLAQFHLGQVSREELAPLLAA